MFGRRHTYQASSGSAEDESVRRGQDSRFCSSLPSLDTLSTNASASHEAFGQHYIGEQDPHRLRQRRGAV